VVKTNCRSMVSQVWAIAESDLNHVRIINLRSAGGHAITPNDTTTFATRYKRS
jgi:hypothetical protein